MRRAERWTRLRLPIPVEATDAIAELCIRLGAPGVVTGERDLRRVRREGRGAPGRRTRTARIDAYFPPAVAALPLERRLRRALAAARADFPGLDPERLELEPFESRDDATAWRAHFPPLAVGRRLLIAPSWHAVADPRGRHLLRIDPGQAFGTGHHATTRGCLLEIERACAEATPERGLDVGCGTGVLALAMRALGVSRVTAADTDPLAREATALAARENGIDRVRVVASMAAARGRFGLVVANLYAGLLAELAPRLAARLAPGGRLVVSGLLLSQEKDVAAALRGAGLRVCRRRAIATWVTLVATPARGAPPRGTASGETPSPGMQSRGASSRGSPSRGSPARGSPSRGAPSRGAPSRGAPSRGSPSRGAPARGTPSRGTPSRGRQARTSSRTAPVAARKASSRGRSA